MFVNSLDQEFSFELGKKRYPRGRKKVLISKCHISSGLSAGEPEKKSFWGKTAFLGPGEGSAGGQILRISGPKSHRESRFPVLAPRAIFR